MVEGLTELQLAAWGGCNGDDGVLVRASTGKRAPTVCWRELGGRANDGICRLPEV